MIRAYLRGQQGAAAVEFALMLGVFTIALPSTVDLGIYAYDTIQVQNSAQMAVQAVWAACGQLPATSSTACPTAQSALNTAVQQTSLGSGVTVSSVTEGYYCANGSGVLTAVGATGNFSTPLSSNPGSCPTGSQTSYPGDYMWVTVSYTYTPVFAQASVASLLGTTIQGTAWMRLL